MEIEISKPLHTQDVLLVTTVMPLEQHPNHEDIFGTDAWRHFPLGESNLWYLLVVKGQHMYDEFEDAYYTNEGCFEI
jgi:hypothetical protein